MELNCVNKPSEDLIAKNFNNTTAYDNGNSTTSLPFHDSIPHELISPILSHLSPKEVCRLGTVSRTFNNSCNDENLWKLFCQSENFCNNGTEKLSWKEIYKEAEYSIAYIKTKIDAIHAKSIISPVTFVFCEKLNSDYEVIVDFSSKELTGLHLKNIIKCQNKLNCKISEMHLSFKTGYGVSNSEGNFVPNPPLAISNGKLNDQKVKDFKDCVWELQIDTLESEK